MPSARINTAKKQRRDSSTRHFFSLGMLIDTPNAAYRSCGVVKRSWMLLCEMEFAAVSSCSMLSQRGLPEGSRKQHPGRSVKPTRLPHYHLPRSGLVHNTDIFNAG